MLTGADLLRLKELKSLLFNWMMTKFKNWPMVYILANDNPRQKSAYVGETTSVSERMSQHSKNSEKDQFTSVNIIFNQEFNQSVIKDYENRLIGLMAADGVYKLTNKNEVIAT